MTDYPFKPFPGSSHAWTLEQVRRLPPGPLRVLDVGAGMGLVLKAIRAERREPVEAWVVEPSDAAVAIPDATWLRSLDELDEDGFDLALALDVIEHTAEPSVTLARIATSLRPGGTLLVSVPNVAHWSMRALLLAGRFDYTERGILDRTHLRFFTRSSLRELIAESGLELVSLSETVVPLELLLPEAVVENPLWAAGRALRRGLARAWPGLLGYQVLAHLRK